MDALSDAALMEAEIFFYNMMTTFFTKTLQKIQPCNLEEKMSESSHDNHFLDGCQHIGNSGGFDLTFFESFRPSLTSCADLFK